MSSSCYIHCENWPEKEFKKVFGEFVDGRPNDWDTIRCKPDPWRNCYIVQWFDTIQGNGSKRKLKKRSPAFCFGEKAYLRFRKYILKKMPGLEIFRLPERMKE